MHRTCCLRSFVFSKLIAVAIQLLPLDNNQLPLRTLSNAFLKTAIE